MSSKFRQLALTIASVGLLFISNSGQIPDGCPVISVNGPNGMINAGSVAPFQAKIGPSGRGIALTFDWTVSDGFIKQGQGTKQIEVIQPRTA